MRLLALLSLLFVSLSAQASLFDDYPQNELFQLKNDEKILLPLHVYDSDFVVLAGLVNLEKINAALAEEDLVADEIAPGKALAGIYALKFNETSLGSYNEFIFFVQIKSTLLPVKTGLYIAKIITSTPGAIRAGRDVWGYPKVPGMTTIKNRSNQNITFDVKSSGDELVSVKCYRCQELPFADFTNNQVTFVTPYKIRRSWAQTIGEGKGAQRAYDPAHDSYAVSSKFKIFGKKLSYFEFAPIQWQVGKENKAVGLK